MSDIFIYNPTGEMAIANGMNSYMPPKKLRRFENDLAFLPSFFASCNDIILSPQLPEPPFLALWHSLGLEKMQYISSLDDSIGNINCIKPWSWNPVIHHKTKHLKEHSSAYFKASPNYRWKEGNKAFFSRNTTNRVQAIISKHHKTHPIVEIPSPAISITTQDDFNHWMRTQKSAILKMPWSSSGRGIHVIDPENQLHVNHPWIQGALQKQGFITAEPFLNKVFDFSFQLTIKQDGEINFEGISYFINNKKGHFIGGNIHWPHKEDDISHFLKSAHLNHISTILVEALKSLSPQTYYEGPIGIDAIVFINKEGRLKIHPCVDINWRYNMGVINIILPRFVDKSSIGIWKVSSFPIGQWNSFIDDNCQKKPLITNHHHKIKKGFINLTPPNEQAAFGVWMEVWPR